MSSYLRHAYACHPQLLAGCLYDTDVGVATALDPQRHPRPSAEEPTTPPVVPPARLLPPQSLSVYEALTLRRSVALAGEVEARMARDSGQPRPHLVCPYSAVRGQLAPGVRPLPPPPADANFSAPSAAARRDSAAAGRVAAMERLHTHIKAALLEDCTPPVNPARPFTVLPNPM